MAGSGATAYAFIENVDKRLSGRFLEEKGKLLDLKKEDLGDAIAADVNREDVPYYENILIERDYQVNREEISSYFEEKATLRGLFDLYEEIFDIKITFDPNGTPGGAAWADDVQFVYIYDASDETNPIGGVYLDLHPRTGKYKHFAQFAVVEGHQIVDERGSVSYRAPVCAIVGNWPVAVGNNTSALWDFDGVNTMFHEFGHALHTVLTCTELREFAGTSVPRDFVEVPSQMLERWLDDPNVLRRFARHYETGEALPEDLIQGLVNSSRATIGHFYKAQVSYGFSDLRIHSYRSLDEIPPTPQDLYAATNKDYSRYYPVPDDTALLASFGHLFGGYDASYYGYAWADAIAADLASSFRASPDGFLDRELGAKFRKEILEVGGSRDPTESIRAFLGRDWNTEAFFEEMGLAKTEDSPSDGEGKNGDGETLSGDESAVAKLGVLLSYGAGIVGWSVWCFPFY